jgi:hypothetical protein
MMNRSEYKDMRNTLNATPDEDMGPATDVSSIDAYFRKLGQKLVDGCNALGRYFGNFNGTANTFSACGYAC